MSIPWFFFFNNKSHCPYHESRNIKTEEEKKKKTLTQITEKLFTELQFSEVQKYKLQENRNKNNRNTKIYLTEIQEFHI